MNCNRYLNCPPSPVAPLIGYTAEQNAATQTFVAMAFGPLLPPPLNWNFIKTVGFGSATSTLSQADADNQAYAIASMAAIETWSPAG